MNGGGGEGLGEKTWRRMNNSGIYTPPFTSNCCFRARKKEEKEPQTARRRGLNSGVNEKVPGVELPARLRAKPRLSEQTFHLCATCSSDETPVKVVQ